MSARSPSRVVPIRDDGREPRRRERLWLVCEWRDGEEQPAHFYFATYRRVPYGFLVHLLKERWRTERVYQDLKGELGLDHFEGRRYPGWHHHVSVALACFAFVAAERARVPLGRSVQEDGAVTVAASASSLRLLHHPPPRHRPPDRALATAMSGLLQAAASAATVTRSSREPPPNTVVLGSCRCTSQENVRLTPLRGCALASNGRHRRQVTERPASCHACAEMLSRTECDPSRARRHCEESALVPHGVHPHATRATLTEVSASPFATRTIHFPSTVPVKHAARKHPRRGTTMVRRARATCHSCKRRPTTPDA